MLRVEVTFIEEEDWRLWNIRVRIFGLFAPTNLLLAMWLATGLLGVEIPGEGGEKEGKEEGDYVCMPDRGSARVASWKQQAMTIMR